jgi:glycosyltransferase involved in cell wall biosynthesis
MGISLLALWKDGFMNRPLRILQVSTADIGGGAEKIAWNLLRSYRARGHSSWLAVGRKRGDDPDVVPIPRFSHQSYWSRLWLNLEKRLQRFDQNRRAIRRTRTLLKTFANPRRELPFRLGMEDFDYPGTRRLLDLVPEKPDVVHCHNLHGGYFDLRVIPLLSRRASLFLTLHDAWLLSGHCAHSFECERWKIGCGQCPDLAIYPGICRDATAYNWRRKRNIFSKSRIHISTPSEWLMKKVEQSMLRESIADARVIPNGVDLSIFFAGDKGSARAALNLPQDTPILLFAAYRAERNIYKDYNTLRAAVTRIAQSIHQRVLFLCLGGEAATEYVSDAELRSIPYQSDTQVVAEYYRAADLYVHASRIDTFPCSVLEALASGTPVVATEVGGIPEQIKGLKDLTVHSGKSNRYRLNHATGVLVAAGSAEAMAESIINLLNDDRVRWELSKNASRDARQRFDLEDQAQRYLEWYEEFLGDAVPAPARRVALQEQKIPG